MPFIEDCKWYVWIMLRKARIDTPGALNITVIDILIKLLKMAGGMGTQKFCWLDKGRLLWPENRWWGSTSQDACPCSHDDHWCGMCILRCPAGWFEENTKGGVQRASQCSGLSDAKDQERSFKGDWRAVWNRKMQFGEQHDRRDQTADENRSKLQETHQWSVSFDY